MLFETNITEPCQLTSYSAETLTLNSLKFGFVYTSNYSWIAILLRYDKNSMMAHANLDNLFKATKVTFETMNNRTSLFINYPIMEVKVSQQVRILDTSSFISSVGGNLGLFIGFSFLDTFFAIYKWFSIRFIKWIEQLMHSWI